MFGWTRDLTHFNREERTRLKADADRVDAVGGHVRFTHGTLVGQWGNSTDHQAAKISLGILSSPKPTATGFYLQPQGKEWEAARQSRWPPVTALDDNRNPVAKLPAYRRSEARLRGRKMYRRRERTTPSGLDSHAQSDQNQTVHALPPAMTFKFRVHFDNLSKAELGALLFALNLAVPDDWKRQHGSIPENARFCHALGHGKPFGMGRCSVNVDKLCIDGVDRYRSKHFGGVTTDSTTRDVTLDDVQPFLDDWTGIEQTPELVAMRSELLELLLTMESGEPISYPPVDANSNGSVDFAWWKNAKLQPVFLPEPIVERREPAQRLRKKR